MTEHLNTSEMYNLEYWSGKTLIETTERNKPKPLLLFIKRKLENTTHRTGTFKIVPC